MPNVELHNLYGNANIITLKSFRFWWRGHVPWMGDGRRVHKILLGKLEEKCPLGRPKIRWEDNIIWDLKILCSIKVKLFFSIKKLNLLIRGIIIGYLTVERCKLLNL